MALYKLILVSIAVSFMFASNKVEVKADSFFADENNMTTVLEGNVEVRRDSDILKAQKIVIYFDKNKNPKKYVATNGAKFSGVLNNKKYDGSGEILTYEPATQIYTLDNNAVLKDLTSNAEVNGDKIIVNLKKGTYEVKSQNSKNPVKLIFEVENIDKNR